MAKGGKLGSGFRRKISNYAYACILRIHNNIMKSTMRKKVFYIIMPKHNKNIHKNEPPQ